MGYESKYTSKLSWNKDKLAAGVFNEGPVQIWEGGEEEFATPDDVIDGRYMYMRVIASTERLRPTPFALLGDNRKGSVTGESVVAPCYGEPLRMMRTPSSESSRELEHRIARIGSP